jgi:hypothetical protein
MTQTDIPTWSLTFQLKLMTALDAAWAILDVSNDPAEIRQARDKAKAIGELAAVARKVALATPAGRKPLADAAAAALLATQSVADLSVMVSDARRPAATPPVAAPVVAPMAPQAEHARRALEKLKGGRRGRP